MTNEYRFILFENSEPTSAFNEQFETDQEAKDYLPRALRESIPEIDRIDLYLSNEQRDMVRFIDLYTRELEVQVALKEAESSIVIDSAFVNKMRSLADEKGKNVSMFAMPNRRIACQEYHSNYAWNDMHRDVFFKYITLRKPMEAEVIEEVVEDGKVIIATIFHKGRLGKYNAEEVARFVNCGFILDGVY